MEDNLAYLAKDIRKRIIQLSYTAKAHHIGSCLSCVEILVALHSEVMKPKDRFILSAGHKAFALYAILDDLAFDIDPETICHHPERNPKIGIEATTGSLGHGLSIGCGMALADRDRNIYVLMSDGELNEGSVWEAAMFAGQHDLNNLIAIIDNNGLQALGPTKDILSFPPLFEKWVAFKWDFRTVPGHDLRKLPMSLQPSSWPLSPTIVSAVTTKGKGISFMENNNDWHYNVLDEETYTKAMGELQ